MSNLPMSANFLNKFIIGGLAHLLRKHDGGDRLTARWEAPHSGVCGSLPYVYYTSWMSHHQDVTCTVRNTSHLEADTLLACHLSFQGIEEGWEE